MGVNCPQLTQLEPATSLKGTTMKKSEGRIFTTHAGSLPRPDGLVELLAEIQSLGMSRSVLMTAEQMRHVDRSSSRT